MENVFLLKLKLPVRKYNFRFGLERILEGESDELGTFCGKMSKKTLVTKTMKSDGNSININFEAGNTVPKRGFRFKIKAIPKDSQKSVKYYII